MNHGVKDMTLCEDACVCGERVCGEYIVDVYL